MPCYHPLHGWAKANGAWTSQFSYTQDLPALTIPCNQCVGCRISYTSQWAQRIMHEASLWSEENGNSFITLTYNDEFLPRLDDPDKTVTLLKRDFQLFMKRLRFHNSDSKIRFYGCGEYGDMSGRPHYHAILFNKRFDKDKVPFNTKKKIIYDKKDSFISQELDDFWKDPKTGNSMGYAVLGDCNWDSAAYVARYCMKKINGKRKFDHYLKYVDKSTGEVFSQQPEFAIMSRGGRKGRGIGYDWIDKYKTQVYSNDYLIVNGRKIKPAKYYDKVYKEVLPLHMEAIKATRLANINEEENTPERLAVKKKVCLARLATYNNSTI